MNSRRGFLQRLAMGSLVAPIGASGLLEPTVKLIEPASFKLPERNPEFDVMSAILNCPKGTVQVLYRTEDGEVFTFKAETFVGDIRADLYQREIIWEMRGHLIEHRPTLTLPARHPPRDQ
jgi:hypothetical protein